MGEESVTKLVYCTENISHENEMTDVAMTGVIHKTQAYIHTAVSLVRYYRSQEGWVSVQMFVALAPQHPSAHTCKMGIFKSGRG